MRETSTEHKPTRAWRLAVAILLTSVASAPLGVAFAQHSGGPWKDPSVSWAFRVR